MESVEMIIINNRIAEITLKLARLNNSSGSKSHYYRVILKELTTLKETIGLYKDGC